MRSFRRSLCLGVNVGLAVVALALGSGPACSSSSPTNEGSGTGSGAGGSGPCETLTVKNYDTWCKVSINGEAASAADTVTACVPKGTVTITATPKNAAFEIGPAPWVSGTRSKVGTITGSGASTVSSTTVDVTGPGQCVFVCCPFSAEHTEAGTGCNVPNECHGGTDAG